MTSHRYIPDLYDAQLTLYHRIGFDDYLTAERFYIEHGVRFSSQQCRNARLRLGLPHNQRPQMPQERPMPVPKERANPIDIAKAWLGQRLAVNAAGYHLDGRHVNLRQIMQETNRLRVKDGQPPILTNPAWAAP